MKIAIVGAGVVGVTTAYELTAAGHDVTVYEQHLTAAEETSFANGGLVLPGWPGLTGSSGGLATLLMTRGTPGALKLAGWPRNGGWAWLRHWKRAQRGALAMAAAEAGHQLARYSLEHLNALTDEHQMAFDSSQGVLLLWRHEREAVALRHALARWRDGGSTVHEIDATQARKFEPALNSDTTLLGALAFPEALNANTRQFTLLLKNLAQQRGCRFEFGQAVARMEAVGSNGMRLTLNGPEGDRPVFDQVVMCAGMGSASLLHTLGQKLPLQPVVSHSVSAAIREPLDAPQSAVIDVRHQVSISRLGQRIRVSGGQRLGGWDLRTSSAELQRLYRVLMDWFPGAARLGGPTGTVQEWCGAQATSPDGLPLVGQSPVPGVWLNLGHGTSGWTMACGSARALADQLSGRSPAIDLTPFTPSRLMR